MSTENNLQTLYENSVKILTDLIAFKTISGEDNNSLINYCDEILKKLGATSFKTFDNEKNLLGKQVIGVCNFPEKNIAGVISQFLILGAIEKDGKVVLVHPSQKSENGLPIA